MMAALFSSCKKTDTPAPGPGALDFFAIDKVLQDSVPAKFGGKAFVIISIEGLTVYSKSFGGYDGNTRLLIASCSKWLSGGVIMKLVDDGNLKLSDTVGRFLPVFTQYGKGNITIAQLFSHTSGFPGDSSARI